MLAAVANVFEWSFEGGHHDCTPLPVGEGTVKLDGARLSCQGRYLRFRIPPPHPFLCLHSFPFSLSEWALASLSPPSSSSLLYQSIIILVFHSSLLPALSPPLATPPSPLSALTCLYSFISPPFLLFFPFLLLPKSFPLSSSHSLAPSFSFLPPPSLHPFLSPPSRRCEPQCLARMNGSYLSC